MTRPLALVTGGLHRIGAAIAARLAEAGYDLALHCRNQGEPDERLVDRLRATGALWDVVRTDLADAGAADALFDAVVVACGQPPSVLINNASLFREDGIAALDEDALSAAMAVNCIAPVRLAQRLWQAGEGVVVNILDQRVRHPVPDQIAYSLAKQALWQATTTLAVAMAPRVRVNAVAPGLTLPTDAYEAGRMERVAGLMPLRRLPQATEIADATLYLVEAASITGQTLFVDGGANLSRFGRDFAHL